MIAVYKYDCRACGAYSLHIKPITTCPICSK